MWIDGWMNGYILMETETEREGEITSVKSRNHCEHKSVFTRFQQKLQTCVHSDVTKQLGYCKKLQKFRLHW